MSKLFTQGRGGFNAGADHHHLTRGVEDDIFHGADERGNKPKSSIHYQRHVRIKPFEIFYADQDCPASLGTSVSQKLAKTAHLLGACIIKMLVPAIFPNPKISSIQSVSWVNGIGCYVFQNISFKISNQDLFRTDGLQVFNKLELSGELDTKWGRHVGFFSNPKTLIEESKRDSIRFIPIKTLPFFDGKEKCFPLAAASIHEISMEYNTRPYHELFVNYGTVNTRGTGLSSLPLQMSTKQPIGESSLKWSLITQCTQIHDEEWNRVARGEVEVVIDEWIKVADFQFSPNKSDQVEEKDVPLGGPIVAIVITVSSRRDNMNKLWFKGVDDYGNHYFRAVGLMTGNIYRDDVLPAEWNSSIIPIQVYKVDPKRTIYVLTNQYDGTSSQHNGFQNFTNSDKTKLVFDIPPHDDTIDVRVDAIRKNGFFSENHSIGKFWN